MIDEFKKFALRGNVIDLAVGFTVGAAFATIARSLVDDIIMPPIGVVLGGVDFSDLFVVLQEGAATEGPYATLADAQAAGAVTWNYGLFINNIITFLIIAAAMFLLVRSFNRLTQEPAEEAAKEPTEKSCPYCQTVIPIKAVRCPNCTSELGVTAEARGSLSSAEGAERIEGRGGRV